MSSPLPRDVRVGTAHRFADRVRGAGTCPPIGIGRPEDLNTPDNKEGMVNR